jgi:alpha,alpha-trehalase
MTRSTHLALAALIASLISASSPPRLSRAAALQNSAAGANSFDKTRAYIAASWGTLTRYPDRCETFADPKTRGKAALYLPANTPASDSLPYIHARCHLLLLNLPSLIEGAGAFDPSQLKTQGLLYLPNAYVVPGGQFNEMYGWDSYFIIRGLILDGHLELAKGMLENFFYEIENYGAVLNANRTYYLTRSQPPFLTSMILSVYQAESKEGKKDAEWLGKGYRLAVRDYDQWTTSPHLAGDTGLSRYFDHGSGPAPEMASDPVDYYQKVARYLADHEGADEQYLQPIQEGEDKQSFEGLAYTVGSPCRGANSAHSAGCGPVRQVALTAAYYKGDRSMRESGFDVSFRFGPFGAATDHFAPICLNSLLYKTENDLAKISKLLGMPEDAARWTERATERRRLVDKYLWDEARGEYFDYDFTEKKSSSYQYATTFYPLWAGLSSPWQAAAVMKNLKRFRQPGGIVTSRNESGAQWDYPYGWAPIQLLACEGMRHYGYNKEADETSADFIRMVAQNFMRDGSIREKYDVVTQSSQTHITRGYQQNVIGFGWTNATFSILANELPPKTLQDLKLR